MDSVFGIGRTGTATCPARASETWLAAAGIIEGAAFRSVDRHGRLGGRQSGNAVALIAQRRVAVAVAVAGHDPAVYSEHSLRSGFATSAARAGMGEIKIAAQTRHASLAALRRYVREGRLFEENLAAEIRL
ncbi:hypothetical protein [Methylorubrum extorquens]|uniref:hypothetical protein n=1 Tax=Methylorubrum extorquens TaxID=408 RepID=UPI000680705D|nr:hypothetical protein [Methylorubrum extorquens]